MKPTDRHKTIRTFIAIPLPKNISLFLGKIQDEIKKHRIRASWTGASSMHLTLRFIGDTAKSDVRDIIRAMETTAGACAPFTLFAADVGIFSGKKKSGIIWSGVKGEMDLLETVQTTLEKKLVQAGLTADNRRFLPHFTLGRFKNRMDKRLLADLMQHVHPCASAPCRIKFMVLFKSDLTQWGAVHTPLFKAKFTGNPQD